MKFLQSMILVLLTTFYLGFITPANANDPAFQWGQISASASCGGTYGRLIDSHSESKTPRESDSVNANVNCKSWHDSDTWGKATQSYKRTASGGQFNFDASAKSSAPYADQPHFSINSNGDVGAQFFYRLDIGFRESSTEASDRPILVELRYNANLNADGYTRDLTCTSNCSKTTSFSFSVSPYPYRSPNEIVSISEQLASPKSYSGSEYIEFSYQPSPYSSRVFTVGMGASARNQQLIGLESYDTTKTTGLSQIGGTVKISFSVNHPDVECFYVRLPDDEPFTGCDSGPEPPTGSIEDILDRIRLADCGKVELARQAKVITAPIGAVIDKLVEKDLINKHIADTAGVASKFTFVWQALNSADSLLTEVNKIAALVDTARQALGAIAAIRCNEFDRHGLFPDLEIQPTTPSGPGDRFDPGIADSLGPEYEPLDDAFSKIAKGIGSLGTGSKIAKTIREEQQNGVPPTTESLEELEEALAESDEQLDAAADAFARAGAGLRSRGLDITVDQELIEEALNQLKAGTFDEATFLAIASALGFTEEEARAILNSFTVPDALDLNSDLQGRDVFDVLAELIRQWRPKASEEFPKLVLKPNLWYQIALPGPIEADLTVDDLFGDQLGSSNYGISWIVYSFDPLANSYEQPGVDGILEQGVGYWIIQITDTNVEISIPDSRLSTPAPPDSDCIRLRCFPTDIQQSEGGAITWSMLGYPFAFEQRPNTFSVATSQGNCADGCTLEEAFNEYLVGPVLWHYEPDAGDYVRFHGNKRFEPWDGFWMGVRPTVETSGAGAIQAKFGAP